MNGSTSLRDTIVIGASAGGIEALKRLLSALPRDLAASVLIAVHVSPGADHLLARVLARSSAIPVVSAEDGMRVQLGHAYVAIPNRHMLLSDGHLQLVHGPRENRARPAIDPLFRSAAVLRRERVIGVVLTGYLDDGSAGLLAIKRCGGVALVQDPADAEAESMPRSAAEALGDQLDGSYPVEELARQLVGYVGAPAQPPTTIPRDIALEHDMLEKSDSRGQPAEALGELVPLTCPECGGPLRAIDDGVRRYRCYTGHTFTAQSLLHDQSCRVEQALWAAVRSMEERCSMQQTLAKDLQARGLGHAADQLEREAQQMREHAETLRAILLQQRKPGA